MAPFNLSFASSKEYLVTQHVEEEYLDSDDKQSTDISNTKGKRFHHLILHIAFAISYGLLLTFVSFSKINCGHEQDHVRPNMIYTPARPVMKYQIKGPITGYPDGYRNDPYFGDPSPELNARWIERLKYAMIRLSQEEFTHYNQSGILLSDDSGYLATPTVYHDLHCVRHLHKAMYTQSYFQDETAEARESRDAHTRHCLHNLAHSVMCNADMTIRVMRWHPHTIWPSPVDHDHECISWDAIDNWAKARFVNTSEQGLLIHPTKVNYSQLMIRQV